MRLKGSNLAEVVLLKSTPDNRRVMTLQNVHAVLAAHGDDLDGFAFVVWARDNRSTCAAVGGTSMPSILAPDFVRNRLLANRISNWTQEDVFERLGYGPPTESA